MANDMKGVAHPRRAAHVAVITIVHAKQVAYMYSKMLTYSVRSRQIPPAFLVTCE